MSKIILTENNEKLRSMGKIDEDRELYNLQHDVCLGFVDQMEVSNTHNALLCRKCKMRIIIPKEINTWSNLKLYFKHLAEKREAENRIINKHDEFKEEELRNE